MSSTFDEKFNDLRIPFETIQSATDDFSDENVIGKGVYGKIYRGQLLISKKWIEIGALRYDRGYGSANNEFRSEILMLSSLKKHRNLASIIGFYDDNGEMIIIYRLEFKKNLSNHLSDPITLTWSRRLQICVGIARALSYIHYDEGRNFSVIHRGIRSTSIVLDENWEAKLYGFWFSKMQPTAQRHRLVYDQVFGIRGYLDPAYERTGLVNHKSDLYSLGVVYFQLLCGMKAYIPDKHVGYLSDLAKSHYEQGKLDNIILPGLLEQTDSQSVKIFSEVAYSCLKDKPTERPNIDRIIFALEKAFEHHQNSLILKEDTEAVVQGTSLRNQLKGRDLEDFKIGLDAIKLATEDFAEKYYIGSGGYGIVYKAELEHFDSSAIKSKTESQTPKRRRTVAIKCIINREDTQGEEGFIAEIRTLTSCKHQNIVSLLGYCYEPPYMVLVYPYMSNGSLEDYLGSEGKMTYLTWVQRIRICIDIARGLDYIHTTFEDKKKIIHCDIKSANILLGENWEAKIADFGLSKIHPTNHTASTLNTNKIVGTKVYLDPEYERSGKLKKESDIYSFGVVLFELLSGRLAYDKIYTNKYEKGLAPVAREHFDKGTLKELVDPKLKEETDEHTITLYKGPNEDSLVTFSKIAYQCVAETQAQRPTMNVVIKELEEALNLHVTHRDSIRESFDDICLATQNFNPKNLIGRGRSWKVYIGEVVRANGPTSIAVKRLDKRYDEVEETFLRRAPDMEYKEFSRELELLFEYKHESIIGLIGYCNQNNENIIVTEYASNKSLDNHLGDASLTWVTRLKIGIDVATGLHFLHGGGSTQVEVVHGDIKSSNIVLDGNWKAKISDFGLSMIASIYEDTGYVVGTLGYIDPLYYELAFLTRESDIYSLGIVLLEMMWGRMVYQDASGNHLQILVPLAKKLYKEGRLDEMVFEGIKDKIVQKSLTTFQAVVYRCLHDEREKRPTASELVTQLKKALEFQEDYEIWEPKLPRDFKEIIMMSKTHESYSNLSNKDLHDMFYKGILLKEGKVWFSLSGDGKGNELISSKLFFYEKLGSRKWRSMHKSRFRKVAKMMDVLNLNVQIKIKTQFLSLDTIYGVHLLFKFCESRTISSKPVYVNLSYKIGSETLHAYFATLRDDKWMSIELCQFLYHKEDTDFEVLLEGFSTYYRGSAAIYVEGIEFRAIDDNNFKVKSQEEETQKEMKSILESKPNMHYVEKLVTDHEEIINRSQLDLLHTSKEELFFLLFDWILLDKGEKLFSLSKIHGKKCHMLPAKGVLHDSCNMKLFNSKHSAHSRFKEVFELQSLQAFRIKCKIESNMLSRNTKYACYLVFKLSEECRGLHCPVKVRDLLHGQKKEFEIIYLRSPSPLNVHGGILVPEQRQDGWMEVKILEFNIDKELKKSHVLMDLKLISYEGTMDGLIVYGLEFRPV